jgi:hypothetical protein
LKAFLSPIVRSSFMRVMRYMAMVQRRQLMIDE